MQWWGLYCRITKFLYPWMLHGAAYQVSHLMRLRHFSSSVNSFFKRACSLLSHPVGLDVRVLVGPFVFFHTLYVRTAKTLVRLRGCAGSPGPSLVAYAISTIISGAGSSYKAGFSSAGSWLYCAAFWLASCILLLPKLWLIDYCFTALKVISSAVS